MLPPLTLDGPSGRLHSAIAPTSEAEAVAVGIAESPSGARQQFVLLDFPGGTHSDPVRQDALQRVVSGIGALPYPIVLLVPLSAVFAGGTPGPRPSHFGAGSAPRDWSELWPAENGDQALATLDRWREPLERASKRGTPVLVFLSQFNPATWRTYAKAYGAWAGRYPDAPVAEALEEVASAVNKVGGRGIGWPSGNVEVKGALVGLSTAVERAFRSVGAIGTLLDRVIDPRKANVYFGALNLIEPVSALRGCLGRNGGHAGFVPESEFPKGSATCPRCGRVGMEWAIPEAEVLAWLPWDMARLAMPCWL